MSSKVMSIRLTVEEQKILEQLQQHFSSYATRGLNMDIKLSQADIVRLAIRELADSISNPKKEV